MGSLKKKSRIDSSEDRANLAVIKVRVSYTCCLSVMSLYLV